MSIKRLMDEFAAAHDLHYDFAIDIMNRQDAGEEVSPSEYAIGGLLKSRADGLLDALRRASREG